MEVWAWLQTNWVSVVTIVWTIDQLLKLLVKLTPTVKDDNVVDFIGRILARFLPPKQP